MALCVSGTRRLDTAWERELGGALKTFEELERTFSFHPSERERIKSICRSYPPFITPFFLSLMDISDPKDPLRLQVIPTAEEDGSGMDDPLAEDEFTPFPNAVHRYPNRLLLVTTNVCGVHCRYCFRKRNWRSPPFFFSEWGELEGYLDSHGEVDDLLISGGDPLLMPLGCLERILVMARNAQLKVIRLGTRVPVVLPSRVDKDLLRLLESHAPLWICLHINHPRELTEELGMAVEALSRSGCVLVSQTVLLKGVNNSVDILASLFMGLLAMGVKPYYLFQCDPAPGTAHFCVEVEEGRCIMKVLWGRVSGLAYPHYAMDLPGGGGKVLL